MPAVCLNCQRETSLAKCYPPFWNYHSGPFHVYLLTWWHSYKHISALSSVLFQMFAEGWGAYSVARSACCAIMRIRVLVSVMACWLITAQKPWPCCGTVTPALTSFSVSSKLKQIELLIVQTIPNRQLHVSVLWMNENKMKKLSENTVFLENNHNVTRNRERRCIGFSGLPLSE